MSVESVLQAKLRRRELGAGPECRIWEHKTFNTHRGVLHWQPATASLSLVQMSQFVSAQVKDSFRVSWWRGFAFGVLIEAPALPRDVAALAASIDTRANSKGTWQWTVLACPQAQIALGVHTWCEGYLSGVYRGLIGHYESLGFEVGSFKKEKDRLLRFLTAVARLKGIELAEFDP